MALMGFIFGLAFVANIQGDAGVGGFAADQNALPTVC
jgi:hypothetical protein